MINLNNLCVMYNFFSIHNVVRCVNRCWFVGFYLSVFSDFEKIFSIKAVNLQVTNAICFLVVRHKIYYKNLSLLKMCYHMLGPFATCIICPIALVIVSGGEILLILTKTCSKSKFNFSFNALGKWIISSEFAMSTNNLCFCGVKHTPLRVSSLPSK